MMPATYPSGGPLYWRDEMSGVLKDAVMAYLNNQVDGEPVTDGQLSLVRGYLRHWINAPCWLMDQDDGLETEMKQMKHLRSSVEKLKTAADISKWLMAALDLGIDPL